MASHYDYGVSDAGMATGMATGTGAAGASAGRSGDRPTSYPVSGGTSSGGGDYRAWSSSEHHRPYAPVQMETGGAGGAGVRPGAPTAVSGTS